MAGSMLQGKAQQEASEEERKRRSYWGVDGEGNTAATAGEMNFGLMDPVNFNSAQTQAPPTWQTSIDDLINRQKNVAGSNG